MMIPLANSPLPPRRPPRPAIGRHIRLCYSSVVLHLRSASLLSQRPRDFRPHCGQYRAAHGIDAPQSQHVRVPEYIFQRRERRPALVARIAMTMNTAMGIMKIHGKSTSNITVIPST